MSDKKSLELTQDEANVALNLIQYSVTKGLPTIQDANNALVIFNKIASLFPPKDGESEGEIVEKDVEKK